jgi:thioredoxin reductase (NADPH)
MIHNIYDLVIIGSGPAGTSAAIYGKMAGLKRVLIISGPIPGGLLTTTTQVHNYLGFPNIDGNDLANKFIEHAKEYSELLIDYVTGIEVNPYKNAKSYHQVNTVNHIIETRGIIIASGSQPRKIGLASETQYTNLGVSYCAICDGFLYSDKIVAVVGGGNKAFEEVIYFSSLAKKIYLIHRSEKFRAFDDLQQQVYKLVETGQVELILNAQVTEFKGTDILTNIDVNVNGISRNILLDGVFVAIGQIPNSKFISKVHKIDGYIITDAHGATNIPHIMAAGDVTRVVINNQLQTKYLQAITAAADGTNAALKLSEA